MRSLDPAMRHALFQIWLNRDYTEYGKVTGPRYEPAELVAGGPHAPVHPQRYRQPSCGIMARLRPLKQLSADPFEGK